MALRKTVLVVDDDNSLRTLLVQALGREGFDIATAANGRAAVEQFCASGNDIHLALIDYEMPELDGLSACRALRNCCAPGTPIILMSAEPVQSAALDAGANAFLGKPFDLDDLLNCVREHIDNDP